MAIMFYSALGALIVASMLIAAANAFTVCVAIPAWRRFSIPAPVAALVLAAFLSAPIAFLSLQLQHHMFILRWRFPYALLFVFVSTLAFALVSILAWAATIVCRAILEFLPPFLTTALRLKPTLLLQAVLLIGATCSATVQLAAFGTLAYLLRGMPALAILAGLVGVAASAACFRVLPQLPAPDAYAPKSVPPWLKSIFLQTSSKASIEPSV